ncbi:MAG: response regulator [Salinivirgaceae bacterium]
MIPLDMNEIEFKKHLNATFQAEADEHIKAFKKGLFGLEKRQAKEKYVEIIEVMFREIHSLKGAARSVNQKTVESVCQPLEDVFSALKHNNVALSVELINLFYKTAELLSQLILEVNDAQPNANKQTQHEIIEKLKNSTTSTPKTSALESSNNPISGEPKESISETPVEIQTGLPQAIANIPMAQQTIRINVAKLDRLLLQAEEFIQEKNAIGQRLIDLNEISDSFIELNSLLTKWKAPLQVETTNFYNERLADTKFNLSKLESRFAEFTRALECDQHNLKSLVDNHLEAMRQILMQPVSTLIEAFPGMVRELALEQGKQIEFIITGTELEIDKRILEELKAPLIHLIRNSIDHGIGKPKERALLKKTANGTLKLEFIGRENGKVEMVLTDDGTGINLQKVLDAAIKNGNLTLENAKKLTPEDILPLIFESGISTSPIITEVSGRGLGLSIVKEKVEDLNGKITVETELNKGTTFRMVLPVSLSSVRGISVMCGEYTFIIPAKNVERVLKIDRNSIKTIENHKTIRIDNQIISVVSLAEVLGLALPPLQRSVKANLELDNTKLHLVVMVSGEQRMAFIVDEVLGEQQVLVKRMGKLLKRVRNISGATILGSGNVVLVLFAPDLIKSALTISHNNISSEPLKTAPEKVKNILVADDSITSRTLLKNILETAGYKVTTAVDGNDAFTKATTSMFDLIISDVDMPHMNGFEFITKIKRNNKLNQVPVIMITALGSVDDRERGIEAGADAYIVKSSFDQFNLIQIIKKLI